MKRIYSNETTQYLEKKVKVSGWVHSIRFHGKIIFADLRDKQGLLQMVFTPKNKQVYEMAKELKPEWVISVNGKVQKRPKQMVNPKIKTGEIELLADEIEILSKAKTIPFPIDTDGYEIDEKIRMKYRYIDLRRERLKKNLEVRQQTIQFMRNFLIEKGFLEVETPILTKSTPEGARDFLVPSRTYPGTFYALPQSPQQYKQLLMVSGIEKYFQIARCFRDEDLRGDRQAEFTQLDVEMSFVKQEEILELIEELFTSLVKKVFPKKKITKIPWPRLSHAEVIKKYNSDKPDLRRNLKDKDELAFAWIIDFPLFAEQKKEDFFHGSGQAKFAPSHHMFTSPHPDDLELLETNPLKVRGLQHDMVLNGFEVAGGSIRIHQLEVQEKVFDLIGFTKNQKKNFKHLLTAFTYGVPPHGGIASGLARLLAVIQGEPNIREVIAFPKTGENRELMMGTPSEVSEEQLKELKIKFEKKKESK